MTTGPRSKFVPPFLKFLTTERERDLLRRFHAGLDRGNLPAAKSIRRLRVKGMLEPGTYALTKRGMVAIGEAAPRRRS